MKELVLNKPAALGNEILQKRELFPGYVGYEIPFIIHDDVDVAGRVLFVQTESNRHLLRMATEIPYSNDPKWAVKVFMEPETLVFELCLEVDLPPDTDENPYRFKVSVDMFSYTTADPDNGGPYPGLSLDTHLYPVFLNFRGDRCDVLFPPQDLSWAKRLQIEVFKTVA